MLSDKSDSELVRETQNGDVSAFEVIVRRYQKKLLAFVCRITFDEAAAEEIVQDAFVSLYTTIERVDPDRRFTTYLFEIAKNRAISYIRTHKKVHALSEDLISDEESIIEQLLDKEKSDIVRNAVNALEKQYKTILTLFYFDDLSYEEISKRLEIPLNTVRTHLYRAKEQLKKELRT